MTSTEQIEGYTFGTEEAAQSPLTLDDLERLKAAVNLGGRSPSLESFIAIVVLTSAANVNVVRAASATAVEEAP